MKPTGRSIIEGLVGGAVSPIVEEIVVALATGDTRKLRAVKSDDVPGEDVETVFGLVADLIEADVVR